MLWSRSQRLWSHDSSLWLPRRRRSRSSWLSPKMARRGTYSYTEMYKNVRNVFTYLTHFSTNLQSADNPEALKCKVCSAPYMVEKGSQFSLSHGFTPRQWLQTASLVTMMCMSLGGSWAVIQLYSEPWIRMLAVGIALLIQYLCLRYDYFFKQI